ncbi:hypothetical protein VB711_08190 [Cronbergia sp. UHCC 0137]|uniref:hypothetical protein n=1 Tax=Cronbergia sp. UHCC 0137 TaxID=3110239 RepID=UPI002B1EA84F|nr:hypothetical protein [Cronbergia sp. UHCC 0137]MEA5617816.1 hypothetical protein [Cronbergia sp. UHCC 0137]
MTYGVEEIRSLIADIDNLLVNDGKRLLRLLPGQSQAGREVLQRVRNFLVKLEIDVPQQSIPGQSGTQPLSSLLAKFVQQDNNQPVVEVTQSQQPQGIFESEQLKSELRTELSALLIQPLQAELSALLQERANLIQEIRQLEQKRLQNYSLTQQLAHQEQMIAEFLQLLKGRLTEGLPRYLPPTSADSPSFTVGDQNQNQESESSALQPILDSGDQLERLASLSRQLDQRLLSLDGTVNVVFESIESNINTYSQSLSQSLERMHSQGMQGEQLVANLINNLSKYLQQRSPSDQSLLLDLENKTLSESLSTPNSQDLPSVSLTDVSSPNINFGAQVGQTPADLDLDLMLSELGFNDSLSSISNTSNIPKTLPSQGLQLPTFGVVSDDVDQLYASLFGPEDTTNLSSDLSEEVNVQLFTPETPSFSSNMFDIKEDELAVLVDPWINQENPNLLEQDDNLLSEERVIDSLEENDLLTEERVIDSLEENDLLTEERVIDSVEENDLLPEERVIVSDLLPEERVINSLEENNLLPEERVIDSVEDDHLLEQIEDLLSQADNSLSKSAEELFLAEEEEIPIDIEPEYDATITVLTDLLVDVNSEQELSELPLIEDDLALPGDLLTEEEELLINDYIPASPEEDLLLLENSQIQTIPEIFLDAEQLQQLDRDLTNFDRQLNPEWELTVNPDDLLERLNVDSIAETPNNQSIEDWTNTAFSGFDIPQSETSVDFSQIKDPEDSLRSNSPLSSDSQTVLNRPQSPWYLGIDLGTSGISASLLNPSISVVYPIYWSADNQESERSFQQSFRLPTEVYLPQVSIPQSEIESTKTAPVVVTEKQTTQRLETNPDSSHHQYSVQLKPYLQVAIPYKNTQQKWEPVLQLNESSAGTLIWVVRSLSKLLLTLKSHQTTTTPALIANAVGIEPQNFLDIINHLSGIICTCPSNWSEQYRFNVREAILTTQLVSHPQQIYFIEEAIATLLPEITNPNFPPVQVSTTQGLRPLKSSEYTLFGDTLAINIGTTATEMALVDLPGNLGQLTHQDFILHSFTYAGKGIEQDIICQLLLPPKSRQPRWEVQNSTNDNSNSWHWQPAIPGLDQMKWDTLGLEVLEIPKVGEPDTLTRIRLQQRLESSLLGQALLDAALALKLILQHQESFTLELADQRWVLQRRDLESQVFVPFVRRLNRELNKLLVTKGIPTEGINQAILTGGLASVNTINRWLRQKLPNAKIIQDVYMGENGAPKCSRVAYGLSILPLHPQILEVPRQQYTDYFLFAELLQLLPNHPLSFGEVLQLFELRGINTRNCQQRLLAFLEGELPSGLIPSASESAWLTANSQDNPDYQAIATVPLFEKQANLTYRPHPQQLQFLRKYLDAIKASTIQSLEEPYSVNFTVDALS